MEFASALFLLVIVLKFLGKLDVSWLVVFSPVIICMGSMAVLSGILWVLHQFKTK